MLDVVDTTDEKADAKQRARIKWFKKKMKPVNGELPDINPDYVGKNLFNVGTVSMVCGPSHIGKSAVAASIAAHVAMERPIGPHPVRRAVVLYVAAEDAHGVRLRAYPFLGGREATIAPFYVLDEAVDLTEPTDVMALVETLQDVQADCEVDRALVIVDTTNLCIGDGDENSARDMKDAIRGAQRIADETRAAVVLIHHTGHDESRPRGSSVMKGNMDALFMTTQIKTESGTFVALQPVKQRNKQLVAPLMFNLDAFKIGEDDDGDTVTVPRARYVTPHDGLNVTPPQIGEKKGKVDEGAARAADVERVLRAQAVRDPKSAMDKKSIADLLGAPFAGVRENADSLRVALNRALMALEKTGKIEKSADGKHFRLRQPT